jgi:serine/threonine-protein kinase
MNSTSVHGLRALPDWSAVPSNSEDDRVLVNRRVAYFGAVFCLLSSVFYVYNGTLNSLLREGWPFLTPEFLLHAAATAVCACMWLACRHGRRSSLTLNLIDIGGTIAILTLFGWMTVEEATGFDTAIAVRSGQSEALLMALITLAILVTRAVIVPGTVRRTFWISLIAGAIAPVVAYLCVTRANPGGVPGQPAWIPLCIALYVGMWTLLAVAVSTIASRVIYGLSQRVREQNQIGQYTLEDKIGEGGMGVVYRARHALLRRPTAVKLLLGKRAGDQAVRRFEQEVQLTSLLTHPNTIAVFDFGHTPDGVFYYAMEYLDGITLEDLVRHGGPQAPGRVVSILRQVASALAEAHGIGLIHRDIKPANLMLCVRGGLSDQIKVLDFGLVKDFSSTDTDLSINASLLGTPTYLSPEAIREPAHIDGRADLYALGAVGYYLLTGEPVFSGASVMEVCAHHLHSLPVPPSERTERPLPAALESFLLGCLSKERELRPASAAAFVAALDALEGIAPWSVAHADQWWLERAPAVKASLSQRAPMSTPGPRTVAVDLTRRALVEADLAL